jgi:hypothetical protein
MKKKSTPRRGQTIVYLCVVLVAAMFLLIFLFDLQYFVRVRGKSQNGIDAAVLTAAKWQGKSLNMIGELNLVRASTIMLDVFGTPAGDTSVESLIAADNMISEMQTRILYVGPILGYAAAQQAAKNNGLRATPDFTAHIVDHIENALTEVGDQGSLYEEVYTSELPYNNYHWLEPYKAMLQALAAEGLAAKVVNSRYMAGAPKLTGPGANLLSDPAFYAAVWNYDYCWFINRGLSSSTYYDFDSVRMDEEGTPFFPGSEFLNLYVGFQRVQFDSGEEWEDFVANFQEMQTERGLTPHPSDQEGLSELNWAVYDNSGNGWASPSMVSDDPGSGLYAYISQYLRGDGIQDSYVYGGAAVRMFCQSEPSLLSGSWSWTHGEQPKSSGKNVGDALKGGQGTLSTYGKRLADSERRLRGLQNSGSIYSSAAAKAFGKFDDGSAPYESGIVLPVFEAVRLMPAALVPQNPIDRNYTFYKFLLEYFGHPDYPNVPDEITGKYHYYIGAMEAFQDSGSPFRTGWETFEEWREDYMAGEDAISGNDDDKRDPCLPVPHGGGGGGGGTSPPGGPSIIH